MTHTYTDKTILLAACAVITVIGGSALTIQSYVESQSSATVQEARHAAAPEKTSDTIQERRAKRLQSRLMRSTNRSFGVLALTSALEQRTKLLTSNAHVVVTDPQDASHKTEWDISLAQYPWLIEFNSTFGVPSFSINSSALDSLIKANVLPGTNAVRDIVVTKITKGKNVTKAETTGVARDGFEYDSHVVSSIMRTLSSAGTGTIAINAPYRQADVTVRDEKGDRKLTLLSTGRSDFKDSTPEREWNVHKSFDEKVNNTVVMPGENFSIVNSLDAPITVEKGWKMALGLFGGGAALTPGGGICQSATTTYRAALLAGLPIVERKEHSLFVDHYESYGVGVDATIFPGFHDLRFKNDTNDILLVQAYTDGYYAFVKIYGTDTGRTVTMDGPYFVNTRPRPAELRPLGFNEIGWVQTITMADGTVVKKPVISHYAKPVPYHSLSKKYASTTDENGVMHAAAPHQEM